MSQSESFEFLVRATGDLRPTKGAMESDLRAARSLLLASRASQHETSGVADTDRLLHLPLREIDEESAAAVQEVIDTSEGRETAADGQRGV